MNCDRCQALVDDYVDGTLPATERAAVETHLAGCAACRVLADDFRAIRQAAGSLERHVPPAQVWTNISKVVEERQDSFFSRLLKFDPRPLAIAATFIVLVGGTSWLLWDRMAPAAPAPRTAATTATASGSELELTVETELKLAEEHYQKAIAGLEQITRTESTALDPQVAAVLQKNLEVIDHAIGESRAALQTQPASEVAQESLFEALRNKVALLQDTVVLINEMRKGNQEGAARIVSGLNQ